MSDFTDGTSLYRSSAEAVMEVDSAMRRSARHWLLCTPVERVFVRARLDLHLQGATGTIGVSGVRAAFYTSRLARALRDATFVLEDDIRDEGKTQRARWATTAALAGLGSVVCVSALFPRHHFRIAEDLNAWTSTMCGQALVDESMVREVARVDDRYDENGEKLPEPPEVVLAGPFTVGQLRMAGET